VHNESIREDDLIALCREIARQVDAQAVCIAEGNHTNLDTYAHSIDGLVQRIQQELVERVELQPEVRAAAVALLKAAMSKHQENLRGMEQRFAELRKELLSNHNQAAGAREYRAAERRTRPRG
jgi:septal ring factor EnvC (AmiA/AmiB activator)